MAKEKKSDLVGTVRIPEGVSLERFCKESFKVKWHEWPHVLYMRHIYLPIQEIIMYIERFIQRGFRGYGDSDMWSMHGYITEIILKMLKQLKKECSGHPTFKDLSEKQFRGGMKRWKDILQQMIDGFQVLYDCEFGPKEWGAPYSTNQREKMEKSGMKFSTRSEERAVREAFKLFVEYYHNLWD